MLDDIRLNKKHSVSNYQDHITQRDDKPFNSKNRSNLS